MTPRCPSRGGQLLREHGLEAPLIVIASYRMMYRKEVMIPRLWKVDYGFLSLHRSALSVFPFPALLSLLNYFLLMKCGEMTLCPIVFPEV